MNNELNKIDVVILCGGLGKRLRGEIGDSQKVMAKVDDKPFLDIILEHIDKQGFTRVVLCTGFRAEDIEAYYKDKKYGFEIVYSKEEESLGTGGAVKFVKDKINSGTFFVLNGDSFCPLDFSELLKFHKEKKALSTVAVTKVDEKSDFGSVALKETGEIISFEEKTEKGAAAFANAGVYCFDGQVFSFMPEQKKFLFENDLFPSLVGNRFFGFKAKEEFTDIGTPERYMQAKQCLKKGA